MKRSTRRRECKADTLNTCIGELQRQAHSNRLELDCVNCGCEESRREQARLHEELAQREKALRDTRIRNIHEVEELKRPQEMRIDEFSMHTLREIRATIQVLTSQRQEGVTGKNVFCDLHQFGAKVLPGIFLGYGENLERRHYGRRH